MKRASWVASSILSFAMLLLTGCGRNGTQPEKTYTISGSVYSVGLDKATTGWPDIIMTLETAQAKVGTVKTNANGDYSFTVPNGDYWLTPSSPGITFDPVNLQISVVNAGATSVVFKVEPLSTTNTTSTRRKIFKAGRKDYSTDVAFQRLADNADESLAITVPGLEKTVVGSKVSTTMVPQGMCFANDYILISAYDSDKGMNSVIYVIQKKDRVLKKTILLPNNGHVGGLAFDGENVWVCNDTTMGVIKYKYLLDSVADSSPSILSSYLHTEPVKTTASFATIYNGRLFVGKFNDLDPDQMFGYEIVHDSKLTDAPRLTAVIEMQVPKQTQGVAFRDTDGLMITSNSYGRNNNAYLRFFRPSWSEINLATVGFVHKNEEVETLTVPPMSEAIVVDGNFTYILFESGAYEYSDLADYCKYPMNRVLPFRTYGVVH